MNRALELAGKPFSGFAADKAWGQLPQVFKDRPEESLGHLCRTHPVGVGEVVAGRRLRSPDAGKGPRMQPQSIAHVIKPDAMSKLAVKQSHNVTPGSKGSGHLLHAGLMSYFGNQKLRNEVANLPQQIQF
jgi:hypothetical protein